MKRFDAVLGWALLGVALLVTIGIRGAYLQRGVMNLSVDEGYFSAFALALRHGHGLPYVDAVSQRGPVLYWIVLLFQWLFGLYTYRGLHLVGLLANACTAYSLHVLARRHAPVAGGIAACLWVIASTILLLPADGLAVTGEAVALPFLATTLSLLASGADARSARWQDVWAGACFSLGVLTKQTALLAFPAVILCVVVFRRPAGRCVWTRVALGGLAPILLVLLPYLATSHLGELWYWMVTYNTTIYSAPWQQAGLARVLEDFFFTEETWGWTAAARMVLVWLSLLSVAEAVGESWATFRGTPSSLGSRLATAAGVFGATSCLAALLTYRLWPHYFLLCIPFFCARVALAWRSEERSRATLIVTAAALIVWSACGLARRWPILPWAGMPEDPGPTCAELQRLSPAGRPTFVWGFDADMYVRCRRPPASRYLFNIMQAGVVPGDWGEHRDAWVVPETRALLAHDLRTTQPDTLVETVGTLAGVRMRDIPELQPLLRGYAFCVTVRDAGRSFRVFGRKGACGGDPDAPSEPK